jgi:hypothetical protein
MPQVVTFIYRNVQQLAETPPLVGEPVNDRCDTERDGGPPRVRVSGHSLSRIQIDSKGLFVVAVFAVVMQCICCAQSAAITALEPHRRRRRRTLRPKP